MITDRNARSVSVEYVIDASGRKTVLVVETDLQLDECETDFDRAAVDALCRELAQHRAENPYLDAIRLARRKSRLPKPIALTGRLGDQDFSVAPDEAKWRSRQCGADAAPALVSGADFISRLLYSAARVTGIPSLR